MDKLEKSQYLVITLCGDRLYCDAPMARNINIESLCWMPETDIIPYVNYNY